MDELYAPTNFDWKTTKDYILTFKSDVEGIVEVNNTLGVPYQKAYLRWNEIYMMKLTVPAYETKVVVRFQGYEKSIELTHKSIPIFFQKM